MEKFREDPNFEAVHKAIQGSEAVDEAFRTSMNKLNQSQLMDLTRQVYDRRRKLNSHLDANKDKGKAGVRAARRVYKKQLAVLDEQDAALKGRKKLVALYKAWPEGKAPHKAKAQSEAPGGVLIRSQHAKVCKAKVKGGHYHEQLRDREQQSAVLDSWASSALSSDRDHYQSKRKRVKSKRRRSSN